VCFLSHNNHFDGYILSHHYDVHPKQMACTLNMANSLIPHRRKSLDEIAKFLGLSPKIVPYDLFNGIRDLPDWIWNQVADGCNHDVHLNYEIFKQFMAGRPDLDLPAYPRADLDPLSITIKMFTDPVLNIDIPRADALSQRLVERKADMLRELARLRPDWFPPEIATINDPEVLLDKAGSVLRSRDNFARILKSIDIEPGLKPKKGKNAKKGDTTYAFAKSDSFMKELLASGNEIIVNLAEAKLGVASTIGETRAKRYANTGRRGQPVPVFLKYGSTFSLRTGGGDKMNWCNLERLPNFDKKAGHYELGPDGHIKKGEIRLCIKAPKGKKIGVVDLSQIEARMLATIAGQWDLVNKFRDPKADVYSEWIQPFYGYPISKETPSERGVGKQLILSAGYMAGAATIVITAALGSYGPPVYLSLAQGEELKEYYRRQNFAIKAYWDQLGELIPILASGGRHRLGPIEVRDKRIWLPNGSFLDYSTLHQTKPADDDPEWKRNSPQWALKSIDGYSRIHKGIVTAHVTSSLAGIVMREALVKVAKKTKIALTCYDEIVFCEDEGRAEEILEYAKECLSAEVPWLPALPVACEGHISDIYDK
jgi:hypothetical protein